MKRTTLKRRPAKVVRHPTPRCQRQRCDKAMLAGALCRSHLMLECDRLARQAVFDRQPTCARCGSARDLQWSHHLSRRFLGIRYSTLNSTSHCAPCHLLLTLHPALHTEHIIDLIGRLAYEGLLDAAYGPRDPDSGIRTGPPQFKHTDLVDWYEALRQGAA